MAHLTDFSGNISFYHFGSAGNSEDDVAHVDFSHAVCGLGQHFVGGFQI